MKKQYFVRNKTTLVGPFSKHADALQYGNDNIPNGRVIMTGGHFKKRKGRTRAGV